jgi:hypothetical protein
VLVVAFRFISKPAAVDIIGVVRVGGMRRFERGQRLVKSASELKRRAPDSIGDGQILSLDLPGRNDLFAGVLPRPCLGLPVAAKVHVIGQCRAGDDQQDDRN